MSEKLIDALIKRMNLKNDAALSKKLGIQPPTISKIRHGVLVPGPTLLINMHEESGFSIKELKFLRDN